MNVEKQHQKTDDTQVVSPLVNDRTYGERWYHRIFDWGLNYWTNLLSSAGFSQWTEHSTKPIKLPFMKNAASPRDLQQTFADFIRDKDPFMKRFVKKINNEAANTIAAESTQAINGIKVLSDTAHTSHQLIETFKAPEALEKIVNLADTNHASHGIAEAFMEAAKKIEAKAADDIAKRSMARARSLTLLMPGFLIVIPSVWLGAKIKPWFVEKLNRHHYGDEAMNDPTLKARHEAIRAEVSPTFIGAVTARMLTFFAAQATAQLVGSRNNIVNKIGDKYDIDAVKNFGVDPLTESFGSHVGGALPQSAQNRFSHFTQEKFGLNWSEEQLRNHLIDIGHLPEGSVAKLTNEMRELAIHGTKASNLAAGTHKTLSQEEQNLAERGLGKYTAAAKDLGRFIAADTFYTMVTALTIRPAVKLLRMIPGMSYKPKAPKGSAYFNDDDTVIQPMRIKVPVNEYGEFADRSETAPASAAPQSDAPNLSINQASAQGTLQQHEHQIA